MKHDEAEVRTAFLLNQSIAGPGGTNALSFTWPAGVPPGTTLWFQHWFDDPDNPGLFASSNGLRAESP